MRKTPFCTCENKGADQLQRLCFRYIDSRIPLNFYIGNFKALAILCSYTARCVSDLVGNPEDKTCFLMTLLIYPDCASKPRRMIREHVVLKIFKQ